MLVQRGKSPESLHSYPYTRDRVSQVVKVQFSISTVVISFFGLSYTARPSVASVLRSMGKTAVRKACIVFGYSVNCIYDDDDCFYIALFSALEQTHCIYSSL